MNSRLTIDTMSDSELQRVADALTIRRSIRALREQIEAYNATHKRRTHSLEVEISTLQQKLDAMMQVQS